MILQDRLTFRDALTDTQVEGLTAYGEARGEILLGIIAVINVIRNRAAIKKSRSSYQALQTAAFSCWLEIDTPDNVHLSALAHLTMAGEPIPYDPVLDVCFYLAGRKDLIDVTGGATHYYNPHAVSSVPAWTAAPAKPTVTIDHHSFWTHVAF